MKEYMFILGRDEELSLLELISYFKAEKIEFESLTREKNIVFVNLKYLDSDKLINRLGGIVKIGLVFKNLNEFDFYDKEKIGISFYTENIDFEKDLKEVFKKNKIRYVLKRPKKEEVLMPSEVIKKDLIENGYEFLVYKEKTARTISVYNPFLYQERDEKRPYYDERIVSSIRLAKILINLCMLRNGLLLDPFCGHGTILQEAMLMGLDVKGIEFDKKTAEECGKNLNWVKKTYKLKSNFQIINGDTRELSRYIKQVDGIVTEPYLGPFLKGRVSEREAKKIIENLEILYFNFFREARKVLKGNLVVIFPVFGNLRINPNVFRRNGFAEYSMDKDVKIPIKYEVKGGKLQREIYVLN